ncbi:unnamed protein product, partial [Vitis vinifera]|uniref:Uncharacterized protein n=1 Tax=Vitis vinifera TaxID=29760 RepID=D7TXC6_VITVI
MFIYMRVWQVPSYLLSRSPDTRIRSTCNKPFDILYFYLLNNQNKVNQLSLRVAHRLGLGAIVNGSQLQALIGHAKSQNWLASSTKLMIG